jgi:hypothetical protein
MELLIDKFVYDVNIRLYKYSQNCIRRSPFFLQRKGGFFLRQVTS